MSTFSALLRGVAVSTLVFVHIAYAEDGQKARESSKPQAAALRGPAASKEWAEVATRLAALEKAVEKEKTPERTSITAAVFGLVGVIVGGFINAFMQYLLMRRQTQLADVKATQERELAENRAKLEIGNSFVQWELKQLSELYGPLRALLGQSNAMYRQMNKALCASEKERFRLQAGADDFDKQEFQIRTPDGKWVRFRTVMHIGEVYGRGYGVEDYFDEVVAIGGRMVKIIEEKAGYARPEQNKLLAVFGEYLAHYAVLKRLHSDMNARVHSKRKTVPAVRMKAHESAVFPQEIQELVDAGFEAINGELMQWRGKAASKKAA